MSTILDWSLDETVSEFSFEKEDLESDCKELLRIKGMNTVNSCHAVKDEDKKSLWEHMQQWQLDKEYLASLDLHIIIAKHIRASASKDDKFDILEKWTGDLKIAAGALADELHQLIREKLRERTPHNCCQESKVHEPLELMRVERFHEGLEHFIGYPSLNVDLVKAMKIEHKRGKIFDVSRDPKIVQIDPQVEWNIVVQTGEWKLSGISCKPAYSIKRREIGLDHEHYVKLAAVHYAAAGLNKAEVIALRLWTGPMHRKYVQDLRGQDASGTQPAYPTTLHAINSGITKIAKVWKLPRCRKVYWGYKSKAQLNADIPKDDSGCRGGVERSFLATTEDFDVAVNNYSEEGVFILEISVGQVNKGADIGWLSQFPHEKEILFNALSNMEVLGNPQMHKKGNLQVYQVQISSNTKSKTLEQYVCLRKHLHVNMADVLVNQALRMVEQMKHDAKEDLVKHLCVECEAHSKVIVRRGENADEAVFNEGRDEYIELVGDVIRFQRQSVFIVDLALRWFKEREARPLDDLMRLATWQLQALKSAFRSCEPPEVTALIVEGQSQKLRTSVFHTQHVDLGEVSMQSASLSAGRLVSLNPTLLSLKLKVKDVKADFWEKLFHEFAEHSASDLCINNFALSRYASQSLKRLDFRNQEGDEGSMLVAALGCHPPISLTDMRVQNCPIGCDGAETLRHALSSLQNLVSLGLSECKVSNRGCTGIANALNKLTTLRFLDLSHNGIGNLGAMGLAQVLSRLPTLKIVDLNHNIVGNKGALALAGVAKANLLSTNLTQLELVDVRFNEAQLRPSQLGHLCRLKTNISSVFCCSSTVLCVAWSPEGSKLASGSYDKTVIIWDAQTGEQKSQLKGHTKGVISVAWSPEGSKIASGSVDTTIIIWEAETGEQKSQPKGHTKRVISVAWSPASGSDDNTVITGMQRLESGKLSSRATNISSPLSVAWSPEGYQIASGSRDMTVIIWDGQPISKFEGHTGGVCGNPAGNLLASCSSDKSVVIWEASSGQQISKLQGQMTHSDSQGPKDTNTDTDMASTVHMGADSSRPPKRVSDILLTTPKAKCTKNSGEAQRQRKLDE